jgi:hypothetical protein
LGALELEIRDTWQLTKVSRSSVIDRYVGNGAGLRAE